jgi:hypothetical protein
MKHAKKKTKAKKVGRPMYANPKGIASLNDHERLTVQQRLARVETSVRQLEKDMQEGLGRVQTALAEQNKVNQALISALRGRRK